jgi:hypothetical protein
MSSLDSVMKEEWYQVPGRAEEQIVYSKTIYFSKKFKTPDLWDQNFDNPD